MTIVGTAVAISNRRHKLCRWRSWNVAEEGAKWYLMGKTKASRFGGEREREREDGRGGEIR